MSSALGVRFVTSPTDDRPRWLPAIANKSWLLDTNHRVRDTTRLQRAFHLVAHQKNSVWWSASAAFSSASFPSRATVSLTKSKMTFLSLEPASASTSSLNILNVSREALLEKDYCYTQGRSERDFFAGGGLLKIKKRLAQMRRGGEGWN